MLPSFVAIILVSFSFVILASAQTNPVVTTSLGKVRGSVLKTEKGLDVYAFRGIPYAEAPIGEKRFEAPVFLTEWKTELDATKDGAVCPQVLQSEKDVEQSEDCLFLNVYSRNLSASAPVFVYIHGGMNIIGSSHSSISIGPQYLLDTDIVLVTFNYRLGALGFLSLGTPEVPGNNGYLDQVMALHWVHHMIADFGGNPDSVTLAGTSSGAMAVPLHMSSRLSINLFHKAIVMSGSSTGEMIHDSVELTRRLARETSCPMYNPPDVLSCLRKLPLETIVQVTFSWNFYGFINQLWGYQIDGNFMHASSTELFNRGNFTKVPLIAGITKDELTYSTFKKQDLSTGLLNDFSVNFDKYATELFMHNFNDTEKVSKLKNFYLGNKSINDQNLTRFGDIFSDAIVGHSMHRLVDLAKKYVDVYFYRFDYPGRSETDDDGNAITIDHADETKYFANIDTDTRITINDPEYFMVERITGMISSFAKMGHPQDMNETKWLAVNSTDFNTMYINKDCKMGYEPNTERYKLWDELFPLNNSSRALYATSLITILMTLVHILLSN